MAFTREPNTNKKTNNENETVLDVYDPIIPDSPLITTPFHFLSAPIPSDEFDFVIRLKAYLDLVNLGISPSFSNRAKVNIYCSGDIDFETPRADALLQQNIILVGSPKYNSVTGKIFDVPCNALVE